MRRKRESLFKGKSGISRWGGPNGKISKFNTNKVRNGVYEIVREKEHEDINMQLFCKLVSEKIKQIKTASSFLNHPSKVLSN